MITDAVNLALEKERFGVARPTGCIACGGSGEMHRYNASGWRIVARAKVAPKAARLDGWFDLCVPCSDTLADELAGINARAQ